MGGSVDGGGGARPDRGLVVGAAKGSAYPLDGEGDDGVRGSDADGAPVRGRVVGAEILARLFQPVGDDDFLERRVDRRLGKQAALDRWQALVREFWKAGAVGLCPFDCATHQLARIRQQDRACAETNLQHLV